MVGLIGGSNKTTAKTYVEQPPNKSGGLVGGERSTSQPNPEIFPPYEPIIVNVKGDKGDPGEKGEQGERGVTGGIAFDYLMPIPGTTAVIEHDLGRDPVAVQVIVDGTVRDEYSVSFPLAGQTVMVGFDVVVQALIRLI